MSIAVRCPKCPVCGRESMVEVDKEPYQRWQRGEITIEAAFPDVKPEWRKMMLTGLHPQCALRN